MSWLPTEQDRFEYLVNQCTNIDELREVTIKEFRNVCKYKEQLYAAERRANDLQHDLDLIREVLRAVGARL